MKAKTITQKALLILLLIGFGSASMAQVGIGTTTPDASAILEISSTTKGFLLPRMTLTEMNAIASPAEGLMVYCTNCSPKGIHFYDGTAFINASENTAAVPTVTSGTTGRVWMDRNLGATRVAQTSDDYLAYGNLYQWGRGEDGHEIINWTSATSGAAADPTTTATQFTTETSGGSSVFVTGSNWTTFDNSDQGVLWSETGKGAQDPCPTGFRLPTRNEYSAEAVAFSSQNIAGAFDSFLKLPASGFRWNQSGGVFALLSGERVAFYWTGHGVANEATRIRIEPSSLQTSGGASRSTGAAVRCIQED